MQIIQIRQDDNNGFVCVVPAEVRVIPVDSIDEANNVLPKLVKEQLNKLDVTFEPVVDGKQHSTDDNEVLDEDDDDYDPAADFYYIKSIKKPSNTNPVAELAIDETPIQLTWFIVP